MSKNNQRNLSEINLGNETYHRGYQDGLAGVPKNIKKSHRHAHRYHIGYRHAQEYRKRAVVSREVKLAEHAKLNTIQVGTKVYAAAPTVPKPKEQLGFWTRCLLWLKG